MKVFSKLLLINRRHPFAISNGDCEIFQSTWLPCLNCLNETPVPPQISFCGCICVRVQHWPVVLTQQCWRHPNYILYSCLGWYHAALKAMSRLKLNMMNVGAFLSFSNILYLMQLPHVLLKCLCASAGQYSQPLAVMICSCAVKINDEASSP